MTKKTEALLKSIGLFVLLNACVFCFLFMFRWFAFSSIGKWLEMNRPIKDPGPKGSFVVIVILIQFAMLMCAVLYYRNKRG